MTPEQAQKQYKKAMTVYKKLCKTVVQTAAQRTKLNTDFEQVEQLKTEALAVLIPWQRAQYCTKYPPIPAGSIQFTGHVVLDSIDGKHIRLNGISFSVPCPTCQGEITEILGDGLNYPAIGTPMDIYVRCQACQDNDPQGYEGHETTITVMITLQ